MSTTLYESKSHFEESMLHSAISQFYELRRGTTKPVYSVELARVIRLVRTLSHNIWETDVEPDGDTGAKWVNDSYLTYDGAWQVGAEVAEANTQARS